ncbi:hypothetical protein ACMXYN_05005 [Neptuniibacter sp. PT8_73]|uniref:hypothetical protein n=1 Tax=Neptuniibacter sp. PT8_73 TaxID=3398206 RepID=UPI0039F63432
MRTAVIQSFREHDVPAWLASCMRSAQIWAEQEGYTYLWKNDAFFDYATEHEKRICSNQIYALTDICRLRWIKELFDSYDRVFWLDADILIFSPKKLTLESLAGAGFAKEVFIRPHTDNRGRFITKHGHNNAFMFFDRDNGTLEHYLSSAEACLAEWHDGDLPRTIIGPTMVDNLFSCHRVTSIEGVGLFSPNIMRDIVLGGTRLSKQYYGLYSSGLYAANLCHFIRNTLEGLKREQYDATYEKAVEKLLQDGSRVLLPSNHFVHNG